MESFWVALSGAELNKKQKQTKKKPYLILFPYLRRTCLYHRCTPELYIRTAFVFVDMQPSGQIIIELKLKFQNYANDSQSHKSTAHQSTSN